MPCADITDRIELVLDHHDRVLDYTLRKLTCGAEIGQANLLAQMVCGQPIKKIMALHGDDVVTHFSLREEQEFLYFKHLIAVQEALAVFCGDSAGNPTSACVTEAISTDEKGFTFTGQLAVELMTDRIQACSGCGPQNQAMRKRVI